MKRRLMFVITEDWYFWVHWIGLAEAARDAGYEVTVVTTVREHGERIQALGLNLVHVDFARGRLSPRANLRTVLALRASTGDWSRISSITSRSSRSCSAPWPRPPRCGDWRWSMRSWDSVPG